MHAPGLEAGQGVKECGDRMEVVGEEGVCVGQPGRVEKGMQEGRVVAVPTALVAASNLHHHSASLPPLTLHPRLHCATPSDPLCAYCASLEP